MDLLRSTLQPVTQNLPQPIADLGTSLLGPVCYKTLIHDIDLSATECVKLGVSKGLGIAIIGASSIVKVPQLLKLLNSQSAEGLSFLSYLLESGSYLISLSYNARHGFPFSTYGETALILVQNIAIASLVLNYSGRTAAIAAWIAGLAGAGTALFSENIVSEANLSLAQAAAGILGVASKVPQILTIWSEGTTGQLSAFAVSLSPACCCCCCCYGGGASTIDSKLTRRHRSSTTSLARSRASSPRCRKSTTRLSCTASSLASCSTLSSPLRWPTTGTAPHPRRQRARSSTSPLRAIASRRRAPCRVALRLRTPVPLPLARALARGAGDRLRLFSRILLLFEAILSLSNTFHSTRCNYSLYVMCVILFFLYIMHYNYHHHAKKRPSTERCGENENNIQSIQQG
jgi:uncharacterized protein with PQ loop repeat